MSSETDSAGGWSLSPTDFCGSDTDTEPISEHLVAPEASEDSVPENESQNSNNEVEKMWRRMLKCQRSANFSPRFCVDPRVSNGSRSRRYRLENLAKSIIGQDSVVDWLSSKRNDPFILRLPSTLSNSLLFGSLLESLSKVNTNQRWFSAMAADTDPRLNPVCDFLPPSAILFLMIRFRGDKYRVQ